MAARVAPGGGRTQPQRGSSSHRRWRLVQVPPHAASSLLSVSPRVLHETLDSCPHLFPAAPEDGGTYSSSGNLNCAAPMPSLYSTTGMSESRFFKTSRRVSTLALLMLAIRDDVNQWPSQVSSSRRKKFVKAVFSLPSKIASSVVFVHKTDYFQNVRFTAAHRPIRDILQKENKIQLPAAMDCTLFSVISEFRLIYAAYFIDFGRSFSLADPHGQYDLFVVLYGRCALLRMAPSSEQPIIVLFHLTNMLYQKMSCANNIHQRCWH